MNQYLENNTNCLNTIHSFNNVSGGVNIANHYNQGDHQSEILRWLSPLEPRVRHQDIQTGRTESVGDWLLETSEFRSWSDASGEGNPENPALFCYGGPGVGKTYISSLVIDRLGDKAKERQDSVACFYFDFASQTEQSPANMLGSLLKQIVGGLKRIPGDIVKAFEEQKKVIGGRRLRVPEIVKFLQTVTSSRRTFICVDALDECLEKHQSEILDSLREILEKSPETRIFITGRQHVNGQIEKHLAGEATTLPVKPNNEDIREYIRMRLEKDALHGAMDGGLRTEITNSLAERNPGSLLLVSITLDSIMQETTVSRRRKKLLTSQGSNMKDVYGATMERIEGQGGERARLGMAALMWISHSERPLQLDELLHAVTVEAGSTELNPEDVPSAAILLSCCLGLATFDKKASRVRLIHFSLQEYLYTRPDLFPNAHSTIAETCLTYLNFRTIKDLSSTLDSAPPSAPFLTYCSLYWGVHARKEASDDVISLALKLFSEFENHLSTKLLLENMNGILNLWSSDTPSNVRRNGFTGLHCASFFGIVEIATVFTEKKNYDLNKSDCLGVTPLIWAAAAGQESVVKLLLQQRSVDPNKADEVHGQTALSWAAGHGHEGVVRQLLAYGSRDPNGAGGLWGKISQAIKALSGKKFVHLEKPDKSGRAPLWWAASSGHEGVVGLLLSREDVSPDKPDNDGQTPLWRASFNGHEGVVKILLSREDVSPDKPDKYGRAPLWWAAFNGYEGVVKLLLSREDISPDTPDNAGRTPLRLAASKGHVGVVKLLLSREDVSPNKPDNDSLTPLSSAASSGHEGVVKLLLSREDVNTDKPDNDGRTPLWWAAFNGHEGVVGLLLSREDVSPDKPDNAGRTSLWRAAFRGHEGLVKLLLSREDVSPDKPDNDGRTPLWRAAFGGHEGVVKLLLSREDVSPNKPDNRGQTPLFWAASNGHEGVVKLLLSREDVSPDKPDNGGQTPLFLAAFNGHEGVVKLLLSREDVNPNMPDIFGRTPLFSAAKRGKVGVVKLLLKREDVDPAKSTTSGETPLSTAARHGESSVAQLLHARIAADTTVP